MLTVKQIYEKYPNAYVVCTVGMRDGVTNRVVAYNVICVCDTLEEVRASLVDDTMFPVVTGYMDLPPDLTARVFRNLYHS